MIEFPERILRERIERKVSAFLREHLRQGQTLKQMFREVAGGEPPWDLIGTAYGELRIVQTSAPRTEGWMTLLPAREAWMVVGWLEPHDDEGVVSRRRRELAEDIAWDIIYWCPLGRLEYLRRFAFAE